MVTVLADRPRGGVERLRGEPIVYSEGLYSVTLNGGLQEWEVFDAFKMIRWLKGDGPFFGVAGVVLVSGPPRQGKGLFTNTWAWKVKRYYKGKHVLRDDVPGPLFGEWTMFNEDTVMEDVSRMAEIATDKSTEERVRIIKGKVGIKKAIKEWSSSRGIVLLQDSVVLKDEFWKDMNKRRPMDPMNLVWSGNIRMWGHLDMLLLGVVQDYEDLDRFNCLPYVTHHVKCTWCSTIPETTQAVLWRVKWRKNRQKLLPIGPPVRIFIDGGAPRPELGGAKYFDLFNSKSAPNLSGLYKGWFDKEREQGRGQINGFGKDAGLGGVA